MPHCFLRSLGIREVLPTPVLPCAQGKQSGFALIIALSLMSFMLLLMLTLVTFTRVETRVSSDSQSLLLARQNALLGAHIAIGQLQKYVGPDQRTTVRSDLDATLLNTDQANGRWLGAYGRSVATSYSQTPEALSSAYNDSTLVAPNGSQAVLLNWLVSGNRESAFSADLNQGQILAGPSLINHLPTDAVNLSTLPLYADATADYALLVGAASVRAASDRVAAPVEAISGGRFAWWVSDEGAKARMNLPIPTDLNSKKLAFVSAPRAAIEWMDAVNSVAEPNPFDAGDLMSDYDPASSRLSKLTGWGDLRLLDNSLDDAGKNRFHDLTPYSISLFTDTMAGGLKTDLSSALATGASNPPDTSLLFTPSPVVSGVGVVDFGVPTWGQLRSFAQSTAPSDGTALAPVLPSSSSVGIYPVVSYAELSVEFAAINPANPQETFSSAQDGDELGLAIYPKLVLWNPYTFPIAASQYEFTYAFRQESGKLDIEVDSGSGFTDLARIHLNSGGEFRLSTGAAASSDQMGMRFLVDAPQLEPGQSLIFSLNDVEGLGKTFSAPLGAQPTNVLTAGLDIAGYALVRGSGADVPMIGPGESGYSYRLQSVKAATVSSSGAGQVDVYLGLPGTGQMTRDTTIRDLYQSISALDVRFDAAMAYPQTYGVSTLTRPTTIPKFGYRVEALFTENGSIRWLAQANPRAQHVIRAATKHSSGSWTRSQNLYDGLFRNDYTALNNVEANDLRASSALSIESGAGITDSTLFEFRPDDQPLISMGRLQQANLSLIDLYPAYSIGNSYADYRFFSNDGSLRSQIHLNLDNGLYSIPADYMTSLYDLSWILNYQLWDQYFVSTVPNAGTGVSMDSATTPIPDVLPNSRIAVKQGFSASNLRDSSKAAAGMALKGGFNVNSTSVQAWRAILGGLNALAYEPTDQTDSATELLAALSRFSIPADSENYTDFSEAWVGYRQLDAEQVSLLASAIVDQIRLRGPFLSLSDFINRRLHDSRDAFDPIDDLRLKGALQAAIDSLYSGPAAINSANPTGMTENPFDRNAVNGLSSYYTFTSAEKADRDALLHGGDDVKPTATAASMAPQFLTQADVLSAIGDGLSARSDTFTIRSYGDSINPVSGKIQGRAWCELIVQRLVEPVNRASSNASAADYFEPAKAGVSQDFGRRFRIVGMRWLNADEI